jgi:hypothetical protein
LFSFRASGRVFCFLSVATFFLRTHSTLFIQNIIVTNTFGWS